MTGNSRITLPLAARELVQRLSAMLGVPFTLTDELGAVLASSGDQPRGRVDPTALMALREGQQIDRAGKAVPATEPALNGRESLEVPGGSVLATEPGIYLPLRVKGRIDGVLVAHGKPDEIRSIADAAAASAGLALEFARGASMSARQTFGPDLTLHQILRGSPSQVRRAAMVARVIGWDFTVPRVALVVLAPLSGGATGGLGRDQFSMIQKFVDTVAPDTPLAQFELNQWVLLPAVSVRSDRPAARQLAEDINTGLLHAGVTATFGIGEPAIEPSLPAFRRSYREAVFAAGWGQQSGAGDGIYMLRDLGPAAFLTPSAASRRRLAERLVQPLRDHPDVLRSLQAFLSASCSFAATADITGLHRHTIRNHLDRVHELTGLDPRLLDDVIQLRLALLLVRSDLPPRRD